MVLTDGLVAYYKLDGDATDISGNGHNGTVNGATFTIGKINNGILFDSDGEYISLGSIFNRSSGSISLWIKPTSLFNYNTIFDNSVHQDQWEMWIYSSGALRFRTYVTVVDSTTILTTNTWYHIVVTWDEPTTTMKLYINGNLEDTESSAQFSNPGTVYLGGNNSGNTDGRLIIDEVGIWNRSLSDYEILQLYAAGEQGISYPFDTEPNTLLIDNIAYYKLDGDATDFSGNGYDGTEYGGVTYTTGKINQAGNFDGTDDYIRLPDENGQYPNLEITLSVFVFLDDISNARQILDLNSAGSSVDSNNGGVQLVILNTGEVVFRVVPSDNQNSNEENKLLSSTHIQTGQWYHIVGVRKIVNSQEIKQIWLNGELDSQITTNNDGNIVYNYGSYDDNLCNIGVFKRNDADFQNFFDGRIDEVGIWDRALTEEEITQLYNNGDGLSYPFTTSVEKKSDVLFFGGGF